ncbi:site-specific DNA-methyltransferase [Paenibacillus alvei]|uniref:Methyltransferase n=1 Tax=Paenibacillus alvei TaxID=44250 RepID=A0ABT4GQM7_PAEAL|nr:site-specific DNA-methyltransferase [Paenibacillus alvei]MCY9758990.1 site-specific DNA-methyltransferase [Paenibacillus alvei]MCY9770663.1 site-specific DNA-methyltransferase [Paenibacillus alvei]
MIYNMDCITGAKQHIMDESLDLVICDPPYNLGFGGTTQTKSKKPRFSIIANDNLSRREYQRFTLNWLREAYRTLKTGRHIYIFIDWRMYSLMALWVQKTGFIIKNCIVWDKEHMGMGWQYRYRHEFIIMAVKGKQKVRRISTRSDTDVWRIPRIPGAKTIHPTEKPVALMERIILNSSEEGELIGDFFLGSGPVVEAAPKHGRNVTGFEIDPLHYQNAIKRV